jgi:multidrug efflux pump subunit AcrA (membrane-fusion protein)
MSLTKLPTITKVFLALVILGLTSGVLPGQPKEAGKTITVPAVVQSFETVEIFSLVTGRLAKQMVDIGDRVKKGQVLAEIDAPILVKEVQQAAQMLELVRAQFKVVESQLAAAEASVKESRSRIEQREADLQIAKAGLELRIQELKRFKALAEQRVISVDMIAEQSEKMNAAKGTVEAAHASLVQSKSDMQIKLALVDKARAEIEVQRAARIRVQESALDLAKTRLEFTRIIAPFDGVVTRRQFTTGDLIRAGDHGRPLPLFIVQRMDRMRVILQVPEKSASLVQVGMHVELTIPNLPSTLSGDIARTAQAIEEGRLRVEMDVANPRNLLLPGMTGKAAIHLDKAK